MRKTVLLALLVAGCRDSSPSPAPEPVPPPAVVKQPEAETSQRDHEALSRDIGGDTHAPACPDEEFETHEHCVWLAPAGETTAAQLAKKMTDAGFPAEASEGERVIVWWTPGEIEAFFGRRPTYTLTGSGSSGFRCIARVPDEARPPAALRASIERWIVDDPVCEL